MTTLAVNRRARLAAIAAALILVANAGWSAGAIAGARGRAASPLTCMHGCRMRLRLRPGALAQWSSPQLFAPTQNVEPVLRVGRARLDGQALSGCHARFYGAGVVVDVSACGKRPVPMRLRAATIDDRAVTVAVTYWLR